jgi:hypothetical protein
MRRFILTVTTLLLLGGSLGCSQLALRNKVQQVLPEHCTAQHGQKSISVDAFNERATAKVDAMAKRLETNPNWLLAAMHDASRFNPAAREAHSGAIGLLMFIPPTSRALGIEHERLATLSAEEQLSYVERYFAPYSGKLQSVEDGAMAVQYPVAVGMPQDKALPASLYSPLRDQDSDKNGVITKGELARTTVISLEKLCRGEVR